MEKFRVGIIGNGAIAKYSHIPALKKMENIEIVALCDIKQGRADELNKEFSLGAKCFLDYKEMIKSVKMDAVHVCTPNYLHSEMSVYALQNGLHTFCEKPDSTCIADAIKMKEAEEKSKKVLMVMRNNRFYSAMQYLKGFIERGDAGEIYAAKCGWQRRRGIPGKGGWFTNKSQSGGGPLIDLGVHMIDLAVYLMGNPKAVSVSGSTFTKFADAAEISDSVSSVFGDKVAGGVFDVEDLAMGFVKFDNGACLQLEFSWASNIAEEKNYVELRGAKAGAIWEHERLKIVGEDDARLLNTDILCPPSECHPANIAHFYDVIAGKAQPIFRIDQGINILQIICGLYESARTGKEVCF